MVLVDTNVLLDVVTADPVWADWSQRQLETLALQTRLAINLVVYAELSIGFQRIDEVNAVPRRDRRRDRRDPAPCVVSRRQSVPGLSRAPRGEDRRTTRFLHRRPCRGRTHGASHPRRAPYRAYFPSITLITPADA